MSNADLNLMVNIHMSLFPRKHMTIHTQSIVCKEPNNPTSRSKGY
jgi:hypothetical protein